MYDGCIGKVNFRAKRDRDIGLPKCRLPRIRPRRGILSTRPTGNLQNRLSAVLLRSTMTSLKKTVLVILLTSLGTLLGACAMNGPKKSAIPWSQPAGWEGQIPGMGQPMGR